MTKKQRVKGIIEALEKLYPKAECSLDYTTPHELLVAVILASQCTDARVNIVTEELFKKYTCPEDFAAATVEEMEEAVRSTGFYRAKAKAIVNSSRRKVEVYGGKVPDTIEELLTLDGVGRKIANLMIGEVYGKPAVIVDTHVKRLAGRMGLTESKNPDIIERDLRKILPEDKSTHFNHLMVFHGRAVCKGQRPDCENCAAAPYCKYGTKVLKK
ncbi:MAG: endonuclease III [Abditibacteriota bacterium]|nr:endonuclease III [Abditibacteriota bacterium]